MAKAKFERTKPHANIGTIGHFYILTLSLIADLIQWFSCEFKNTCHNISREHLCLGIVLVDNSVVISSGTCDLFFDPLKLDRKSVV